jgi:hypothetical protein
MNFKVMKQIVLDRLAPKPELRWGIAAAVFILYAYRIYRLGSFHLISYALGIYLLHALILFLTPKGEYIPDPFENADANDDYVPEAIDNEFRPFVRNLPEFDFWVFVVKIVSSAFVGTFFDMLDIPVYTPVLVVYFVFMVLFTAKCLLAHMKKYNYNPFIQSKEYYKK